MKIKLEAKCLWGAIEPNGVIIERHVDRMALDAICSAVPSEMISTLAVKDSAKEAWDSIRVMRIGDDRIRKTSAQRLRRQYEELTLRDGEGVEDFALRLTGIVNQLSTLGDPEDPKKVVEKYLRIARVRYKQLVISMETLLDISTLSVDEVTGRLLASEDNPEPTSNQVGGKLFLTEEQWVERYKQKEGGNSRTNNDSSGRGKRRGPNAKGRGGSNTDTRGASSSAPTRKGDSCRYCGKLGHWARECRSRKRDEEGQQCQQAHVAQVDEAILLLAHTGVIATAPSASPSLIPARISGYSATTLEPTFAAPTTHHVELMEEKVFAVLDDAKERYSHRWIFDTRASNHMTGCREAFFELDTGVTGTVRFGDGSVVRIEGCGTILFSCKNGEHRALPNTYYIPRLTANIVSCGQLDEVDFEISIRGGVMQVRDEQQRLLAKISRGPGRLYVLELAIARPICLAAHAKEDAWRWHARFGHTNFAALRKMGREGLVRGLPVLSQVEQLCEACLAGKHRRASFPSQASQRSATSLELFHGDLYGPITPATPSGNRYFLLLVDDFSRYTSIALLDTKDAAPAAIKRIQVATERRSGKKLLALRTDRGGEFTSAEFSKYCAELGVVRQLTAPYTPQQNGVAERRNQTIVGMARSMLKASGLPGSFWGEATNTAVYILNRTTTRGTGGRTPYELWNGSTPAVHHLRTFGCVVHVKTASPHPKKLDDRSRPMIFVGYEPGSKAYRVYDPTTRRVHISRDAVFDEEARWEWGADTMTSSDSEFTIQCTTVGHPEVATANQPQSQEDTAGPSTPASTTSTPTSNTTTPASTPKITFASTSGIAEEDLDVEHEDDAPLRFRTIESILGPATKPGIVQRDQEEDLLLVNVDEPASYEQAMAHDCWRKAMLDEMTSIEANNTWELVDPPPRQRPIGLKWVFKTKRDSTGIIIKHKARLVAKGYVQRQGVDFDEVFAPVARLETVRLLLALAASEGWPVHHMDVKSAFLNGELREDVYVAQPPGFVVAGKEQKVLRLIKALYGLRQVPRVVRQARRLPRVARISA